jgi:hypothetical protein
MVYAPRGKETNIGKLLELKKFSAAFVGVKTDFVFDYFGQLKRLLGRIRGTDEKKVDNPRKKSVQTFELYFAL